MRSNSRTHEENQERAYIAASRRSDRSVEARVESARRASEIHKRRTGKALKVTEKDVLADEMYEEEDDELPAPYRNLNAHLQTGSSDFDARLQAYLANAVAFRKALSGVSRPGDKTKQADFVNKRQLADHTSLFPKHSDAWKDIVIPKCGDSQASPFLPQGTMYSEPIKYSPYDAKSSGLSHRRMSASKPNRTKISSSPNTSDTKDYNGARYMTKTSRSKSSISSEAVDSPDFSSSGINYDAIDHPRQSTIDSAVTESPFSSRLPLNALEMLIPYQTEHERSKYDLKPDHETRFDDSALNQKQEDSIDATLVAPPFTATPTLQDASKACEITNTTHTAWNPALWDEVGQHDSVARKTPENDLWGSFINDSNANHWDWQTETTMS